MLAVVGAGTMGSLIAALGCVAGEQTLLWDADADALERGLQHARDELAGGAERGRWEAGLDERLGAAGGLGDVARADVIVEAIVEKVEPKSCSRAWARPTRTPCWPPTRHRCWSPRSPRAFPTRSASSAFTSSTRPRA